MSRHSSALAALLLAGAALAAGTAAHAQLLPTLPVGNLPLPNTVRSVPVVNDLLGALSPGERRAATVPSLDRLGAGEALSELGQSSLAELRRVRLGELIRSNPALLDTGPDGMPVR